MRKPNNFRYSPELFKINKLLLGRVFEFEYPVDKLLSTFLKEHRVSGYARDVLVRTCYYVLRNYYKLRLALSDICNLDDNLSSGNLDQLVALSWLNILNFAKDKLIQELPAVYLVDYKQLSTIDIKALDHVNELPQWLLNKLHKDQDSLAYALNLEAPLDLRINTIKINSRSDALKALNNDSATVTMFSPYGIRLSTRINLSTNELFTSGQLEVQDESSQLAALLLNPKRKEMVVDFCAGAGGKTLIMGALMHGSGRIYAFDTNRSRLSKLSSRLARSGLSNVYVQSIVSSNDTKVKRLFGKIDKVFVDAPCSGSGTLRRNPDLKWRITEQSVARLNVIQYELISSASKLVKPGGYLLYATCSILQDENQSIVEKFLLEHKDFKLACPTHAIFSEHPSLINHEGYMVLLPHIHKTDGFFAALMQRS